MSRQESFLILGGAGLVGKQIAREIAKKVSPRKIIIASLKQEEVESTLTELQQIFKGEPIEWAGAWGNIFIRESYISKSRQEIISDETIRDDLYNDLFGNINEAYNHSQLAKLIKTHQPDVIIDSINTATAISYQDAYTASQLAKNEFDALAEAINDKQSYKYVAQTKETAFQFDILLLSQALPQLVRHVQLLYRAMCDVGTRLYLKIGTTGTGGMGLNIPYTHSEDKPSVKLMTKTAVAFAHTGLLFLMARTPDGPIVKEMKPGAMIGYADIRNSVVTEKGAPVHIYDNKREVLADHLILNRNVNRFECLKTLELPVVDTGENGLFTKGEFEAITALRQMEFITPEEIAREALLEIRGGNSGFDVIAEIDSAIMNPTYRAGYLRRQVIDEMEHMEKHTGLNSVALGQLGPPEISKLLWEAELLKHKYGTLENVLQETPESIADTLYQYITNNDNLRHHITSIGLPILTPDGEHLLRGPRIRIPEIAGVNEAPINQENIDLWAEKGWVDLRPKNFAFWQRRFDIMCREQKALRGRGSAAITRQAYLYDEIRIGEVVAWIFNNEEDGYRIK